MVATPLFWANIVVFAGSGLWGLVADRWGKAARHHRALHHRRLRDAALCVDRRSSLDRVRLHLQGVFGGSIFAQNPSYPQRTLPDRGARHGIVLCLSQGAIWGGLVAPVISYFAVEQKMGFAMPMMVSTIVFLLIVIVAVALGPETKGKILTADLETMKAAEAP